MSNKKNIAIERNQEKHNRRMEIATKYQMTKNIRSYMIFMFVLFVIGAVFAWWGFLNIQDPFIKNVSNQSREIIAWIGLVIGSLGLILTVFLFYVMNNARKYVLQLINIYDQKYPNSKYDGKNL